ncbi:hypothetical protein H0Z60_04035 [Ectothiorhodospiraceae bacterium WFHF3C12]|nr:hypothetical protein [Ectothiorhodospiraceae bacterium WFHF3C12]
MNSNKLTYVEALAFGALIACALLLFWPGVSGPFVFDDLPNLKAMQNADGAVDTLGEVKEFIFRGRAPARALSYLSFLVHDNAWPTDPRPFKIANILIHLLNGVLVFMLAKKLAQVIPTTGRQAIAFPLLATALWLLHPIHLSTMMLVVQRLVEISAMFTLAGLIAFVHGRAQVNDNPIKGYLWMSLGIGLGGPLAILGKGTGILIAVYAIVLEATVFRHAAGMRAPKYARLWFAIFTIAPLVLLLIYIGSRWERSALIFEHRRDFTIWERLLTEPRVLFNYIGQIFTLRLSGSGIYHADFPVSRGLFTPWTTLPALLGVLGSLAGAIALRRRWPIPAFAVLWFLGGHSLESTFLHLELYFEHRNYVPMLGPVLALSYGACRAARRYRPHIAILVAGFLVLEIATARHSAAIWGSEGRLAAVWAEENPSSVRARQTAADYWATRGHIDKARQELVEASTLNPNAVDVRLQVLFLDCVAMRDTEQTREWAFSIAQEASFSFATIDTIDHLIRQVKKGTCQTLDYDDIETLIDTLLENRNYGLYPEHRAKFWNYKAQLHYHQRALNPTIHALEKAFEADPRPQYAMQAASNLLSAGLPEPALEYLKRAEETNRNARLGGIFDEDLSDKIAALRAQAKAMQERKTSD